jgi:hypothetical protein
MPVRSGKFTKEQYDAIDELMKEQNINNKSRLVREAVMSKLGIDIADGRKKPALSEGYLAVYNFVESYKKDLGLESDEAKRIADYFNGWGREFSIPYSFEMNDKLQRIRPHAEKFLRVKKGGKKNPARRRGRKPDTGTDVKQSFRL